MKDRTDKEQPVVLVIAARDADAKRLQQILNRMELATRHLPVLPDGCDKPKSHEVVVYCHRQSGLEPTPQLPPWARDVYWMVLSDNDAESAIVKPLNEGASHVSSLHDSDDVIQVRLQASLRLRHGGNPAFVLSVPPYEFHTGCLQVTRDGARIALTPMEFKLAFYLFSRPGRTVSRTELLQSVWCYPTDIPTRRIDTASCHVRRKLGLNGSSRWQLTTTRSKGYILRSRCWESLKNTCV